ncbi:hypothetical protein ABSDF_p30007 (plasmid) [Acinetobacter baumannii SDF]|uniref:DUF2345 domain-containing protein n=1 Tax=Acinetobacter baumannii (strain SDF) TaxID=509170 RepID=B0VVF1_ACIBS|nr:hypothetical protein ABSDF_p30007 [Acinetobacter baumannii SDF]
MAGGSRIVISDDGITISTGGKIVYQAGQHKFEGGQKVVFPMTVLPTAPNDYSHKVNYKFEYTDGTGSKVDSPDEIKKQVFVIEDSTAKLIAQRNLNNAIEDTTLRFHTEEAKPFTALLFNSENIVLDKPDDPFFNEDEVDEKPLESDGEW